MERVLILTALEQKERQIVLSHLQEHDVIKHPISGTDYYRGTYEKFDVFIGRTDQTNVMAALETERAISFIKPEIIFFVGIAGGLKDVKIGDVVIGQDVFGYERGKSVKEGEREVFKPRSKFGASSYFLERHATNFSTSGPWNAIKSKMAISSVSVLTGTIASGEQVNASRTSELSSFLHTHCDHALAVEMEGLGFLEACRPYPQIQSLLIRGISDLVDGKSVADKLGSQESAMRNASAFLFGLLASLQPTKAKSANRKNNPFKSLVEILCKLYPEGIKMNRIWQRAGGDISLVALSNNGYTQWMDAIELIENGGGGNITIDSIIETMKNDFPHNPFVKSLNTFPPFLIPDEGI
jgi:adenosylhomocysteine nucleosidase